MRRRPALVCAACFALLAGCAGSSLDLGGAGRSLRGSPPAPVPVLEETPAAALPAPEDLQATQDELREISLAWKPVGSQAVGGYVVERSLAEGGPFSRVAVLTDRFDTGLLDRGFDLAPKSAATGGEPGLGDGAVYHYRVRAFDDSGHLSAAASAVVAGRTAPPPDPPEDVHVLSRLPRKVALGWTPSKDPTVRGYLVSRSPGPSGPFEPVAEITGRHSTHYVDRGLGDLRVFYYQVTSLSHAGARGAPSEAVVALTKADPLPPGGLRIAARDDAATVVAWDANVEPDVVVYRVLRRTEPGDEPSLVGLVRAPETSLRDPDAPSEATASYLVIAVDADGLESVPAEISVAGGGAGTALPPPGSVAAPGS